MWVLWRRNLPSAPANIFDFNHIDPDVPAESVEMLKKLYAFYHKKHWCYAELFRIFTRRNLFCNAMAGKTIISSAGAGGITLNPALFAVLTGFGLVVKGVVSFKQCGKKAEKADLVRIAYKKILDAIRFLLRGDPFNEKYFLDKLRMIDDFISNHCMDIPEQICTKYSLHFTTGAQNSTTHRIFVLPGGVPLEKCCREGKRAGDEYLFFSATLLRKQPEKIGQKTTIVDRFLPGA